ncbi:uncharacterized protein mslnb isoform X1 [Parambassis ranga]|uniref:Uncharacterized protein LOC114441833 isoform X1 n=1 Tax=Parambassis ranga TaxID=210632 RepID=A0A6P7J2I8_9TELE|nr:uncharacterized protein LOC114441833 isoform X1 [Parambassis ranga]XP_028270748.1 uncharacterized protein LOC114441833 isoform X1 [Parambassis ranga]
MRPCCLFLLIYLLGSIFGGSSAQSNTTCPSQETCNPEPPAASQFLNCVGLPSTDTGADHLRRLKGMLEAMMDLYTFMKSSMTGVPLLSLQGELDLNLDADPLQNEALVQMWLEVKINPLLDSISKHFLSCLSTKNFSCSTYQTVVRELSQHFSEMNPVRQKWIYTFFMYPFLSGDRVTGCVNPEESSEEWLMKNFGAFRAMARLKDFSTLNMVFSGLEVLHLLSPTQMAELLMRPEVQSLDNGTLSLIFHSLMTGSSISPPTASPGLDYNWTSPGYPPVTYNPYPPSSQIADGFMTAFKPIGSFVHNFVSFTHERNVSQIRSTTLTQFLLNWTLAELADMYRPQNTSGVTEKQFDVTNVEDWYQQVVLPVLRRFLPDAALTERNITLAFYQLFNLENGINNGTSEIQDVCSITLDKTPCGLTNMVENVAYVLRCAAHTNLTLDEQTVMTLILELTRRLNSLVKELSTANFQDLASEIQQIFSETEPPSLTQQHLQDPNFISLWFQIKLLPLLPAVQPDLLSCLSTKNFSCPVYQTIVSALSKSMMFMGADVMYSHNIYKHFIFPFLLHHNTSDPQCVSSASDSADWLQKNFGFFSQFASITDFYQLNPNFSGLEALHLLSVKQIAEMLLLPLRVPPTKDVVINQVFDFLTESPADRKFLEVLQYLVQLAKEVNPPCNVLRQIFERMYRAIPSLSPNMEPLVWAQIDALITIAPEECVPENITCPVTQFNGSNICMGVDSSDLQLHLNTLTHVPCNFPLEKYACAQLGNVTANQLASLLMCDLPRNSSYSKVLWKMLLTKLSSVLDPALDILGDMPMAEVGPAAMEVLDVINEIRLSFLTDQELMNSSVIGLWFSHRLSSFLPSTSGRFLHCLTNRNLSCQSYQQILQVFINKYNNMTLEQQYVVLNNFILRFLQQPQSGAGCASNTSAEWLRRNLGPFSMRLPLRELLLLKPDFNPLEALELLAPQQIAEILELKLPTLPDKDVIINVLFDFLTQSSQEKTFSGFLPYLVVSLPQANLSCSSYKILFNRLDLAMATASLGVASSITYTKVTISKYIPLGCVIYSEECTVTMTNETDLCIGVNSTALQLQLDAGKMSGRFCDFALEEFACASLSALTAKDLAVMLTCNRPSNTSGSRPVWKLILSKASHVLDEALDLLASMTLDSNNNALSVVLDSIREIRLDTISMASINDPAVIMLWFNRLQPFLPAVSLEFLSCLTTKGLNCSTYQHILQVFINKYNNMTLEQQYVVLNNFILRFLQQPQSGAGCASNTSAEWLRRNLGPFSMRLPLRELLLLKPDFNPLEALELLAPQQIAEILELKLPTLPDKDVIINVLFDFLTQSSQEKTFSGFLPYLVVSLPQANLSCSSYKILFNRLDLAMATASLGVASSITYTKLTLSKYIPLGCVIYRGECTVTMTNETDLCIGVNSTALQLQLDAGKMSGRFCDFALEEFACASLSALTAKDLAVMLTCNRPSNTSGSRPVWKLILSKASHVLNEALDLLASMTLDSNNNALSVVLDSIREIRLDTISMASINDPAVIMLWFNRLQPFLPAVSPDFLSCLTTKGLNCSTYQHIVQILSRLQPNMTLATQMSVYTHFIKVYLTRNNTADPACSLHSNNSGQWLQANLGGFSVLVSLNEIHMLYSNFSAMEALPQLTVRQLAELSSTPGQLTTPDQVTMVMNYVPNEQLAYFYDNFSPAIIGHESTFPPLVRSAMLQVVFNRANLADPSVSDTVVLQWLGDRLRPLLVNLSPLHVAPFFRILSGRNCSTEQQGVENLNLVISTLSGDTQTGIYNHILQTLKGPTPLRCYGNNYNHSFYNFLESSFMGFQFPNLTTFLSLMPHDSMYQLVNSIPPSHLRDFLSRPDVVDNDAQLCVLYNNYAQTPVFLETESVPADVRRLTLPCVWPMALSSPTRSEVNAWFDQRLHNYLAFLTKSLISPSATYNSTCMAFQKLVLVLDQYNYAAADFGRQDVYNSIRNYLALGTGATRPRCYNPSDPELNSTAWFAEYIGAFMPFLTLEDLLTFGSKEGIQVFTVNPDNIALLSHSALPVNLTSYYTQLIYTQNSNFNPLLLPLFCLCFAPGPAFTQLTAQQSVTILHNLTTLCTDLDPQISAALAGNLGTNIDASALSALGNTSTGLSTGQISTIKPQALFESLGTLSSVSGWNQGQANAIIMSLFSSGLIKLNSSSSLIMLGSLIVGIPASMFTSIGGSELLMASKNPALLSHLLSAPQIIQQIFVTQIISVDSNSQSIIQNIPDELATEIPRNFLLSFPNSSSVITTLNRKKWKQQQVELFFDVMAEESATAQLGSVNNLSPSVLQGFTCTGVRTIQVVQIKKLIKACRRGKNKVTLVETQLTCMYNYIKDDSNATSFDLFPYDLLLYYDYILVPKASCRLYFEQLAEADFSVFSSALSYKLTALFNNAKSCLGITNTSLTADTISVLGNMCCTLDGSYIVNSHPSILDKLNNCPDLTASQAAAVETLLSSGKTKYGAPAKWNEQTLRDLGMLPLYLSSAFYDNFNKTTRGLFLRYFLKDKVVSKQKEENLKNEIRKSNEKRSKRALATGCTVGTITQVTISDQIFPFDYDVNQFNSCLSASVVKDNLNAITEKVVQKDYLKIVLSKLGEAYSANSTIPETQVRVLGTASRVATTEDINRWNITQIDTLAALMDSSNGDWDPSLARAIITKYLSTDGNKLGSAELNAIGGPNLCSLDVNVLKNISQQGLREAKALVVSNCTTEKKQELFTIAKQAFSGNTRSTVSASSYQLTKSYLAGADLSYVRSLAASNLSMDLATFTSLNENVVLNLTVSELKGLLGTNLPDLKLYENQTLVQNWISRQYQSDLNTLSLGLQGGRADTTTAPPSSVATSGTSAAATTTTTTTTTSSSSATTSGSVLGTGSSTSSPSSSTTTGTGSRIRADAGFTCLVLLMLFFLSQHAVM